jgi:hypothetical protein
MEESDLERAHETHEINELFCNILVGKPEGKDHLEDPGLEGLIILKSTLMIRSINVLYKENLVQNRNQLWAVVSKVMKLRVLKYVEKFLSN